MPVSHLRFYRITSVFSDQRTMAPDRTSIQTPPASASAAAPQAARRICAIRHPRNAVRRRRPSVGRYVVRGG